MWCVRPKFNPTPEKIQTSDRHAAAPLTYGALSRQTYRATSVSRDRPKRPHWSSNSMPTYRRWNRAFDMICCRDGAARYAPSDGEGNHPPGNDCDKEATENIAEDHLARCEHFSNLGDGHEVTVTQGRHRDDREIETIEGMLPFY